MIRQNGRQQTEVFFEDFSAAVGKLSPRILEGCEACRGCLLWTLRDKKSADRGKG